MPTSNQIINCRRRKYKRNRVLALGNCPQKKGQCIKIFIKSPKKPSSGKRKVARVVLSNGKKINCHIPGTGGHNLQKFSTVLCRGCRVRDTPGIKYRVIRGVQKYHLKGILARRKGRSKYGTKRPKK